MSKIIIYPDSKEEQVCDFEKIEVVFGENAGEDIFNLSVDDDFYLKKATKGFSFQKGSDGALCFAKDKKKDGKVVKAYGSLNLRAMESVGFVLDGAFSKEIDIEEE